MKASVKQCFAPALSSRGRALLDGRLHCLGKPTSGCGRPSSSGTALNGRAEVNDYFSRDTLAAGVTLTLRSHSPPTHTMRTPLVLAVVFALLMTPAVFADSVWIFVGTYTGKNSKGIYRVEFDTDTGKLGKPEVAAEVTSPSFLAIAPDRKHLFCVCEIDDFKG